ncbi:type I polyketide synthase [Actinocorallia populi]|uniref:type I polyketide synthase n=1 Tax=Actinocorallia populi TaxID=2079200 RepID=UPI000D08EF51|nr:type I polyketide synthase [Actinocorallia populi]
MIAVVGLACRFPGAGDAEAFWRLLAEEREGLTRLGEEDLKAAGAPRRLLRTPGYVPVAGLIEGQDLFDPEPFGLPDTEAALLDPQQRLFLECAWRALEEAGHGGGRGAGSVGVFAGAAQSAYLATSLTGRWDPTGGGADPFGSLQTAIATQTDYLPLQTAYRLDLTGPAVAVNTSCSTSLVAVHLAAQSLETGECDTALAGGVSLIVPQGRGYVATPDGIYSEDGRVRPFSARGTGVVYTQGVGVVVLRRLQDALDDGDPILAVVHGSATGNDGADKTGFTAPSVRGQARVLAEALAVASAEPAQVGYVEAHGTGTRLGDPIEVAALRRVFGDTGPAWCGLGSVKSNIGHANSAAGIASFIKTVLAVHHRTLPASLHAEPVNELLGLDGSPFEVVTRTRAWTGPELAGVSSFGIGGTNAHVVVGPAPRRPDPAPDPRPHPVVLSAHSARALERTALDLAAWADRTRPDTADLAHTLQQGRRHHRHRLAVVAPDGDLGAALRGAAASGKPVEERPRLVFAFPGGGSAQAGMGARLYEAEPMYADHVDECAELFAEHLGFDLREVILGEADGVRGPVRGLPALFTVELATARLLDDWGVRPDAVLGHSLGEYTAAVLSGGLPLKDAVRLVSVRSEAMAESAGDGAMLAVPLGEDDIRALLREHPGLDLAAVNAPHSCVVSGPREPITALERVLRAAGHEPSLLRFDGAAHSRHVEAALPRLRAAAEGLSPAPLRVPAFSTLTGTAVDTEFGRADHWVRQLREPVRFSRALQAAAGTGALVVQIGPGSALASLARAHGLPALTTLPSEPGEDDLAALYETAGHLWARGVDVDFPAMHRPGRRRLASPGLAFQPRRLWIDPPEAPAHRADEPDEGEPLQIPVWTQCPPLDRDTVLDGRWLVAGTDDELLTALRAAGADAHSLDADVESGGWTGVVVLADLDERRRHDPDAVTEGVLHHARLAERLFTGTDTPEFLLQVTRGAHRVTGTEHPNPALAALHALPRVIAQEQPGVRWRVLDLDGISGAADSVPAELADLRGGDSGQEVAVRGGTRWIRGITPWSPIRAEAAPAPITDGQAIALITGGLGDVGLTIAEHLARKGLRVVVTTRGAGGEERSRSLERLAAEGLDVEVRRLDAADAEGTAGLLAELAERGRLALIVHAAGVVAGADLQPMRHVRAEHVDGHVHSKIGGVLALREAVGRLPEAKRPGTVVLMSSAGTLVGGIGMGPYCAANRFLDAFAEEAADGTATRWTSIVWDVWKAGPEGGERLTRLPYALGAATGMAALDRVLAHPLPVVAVSSTDLRDRMAEAAYAEPVEAGADASALSETEREVAAVWSRLLGVEVASADADFFALGGHSLLATRMLVMLRGLFGVELRLRDLLGRPTLGALASLLGSGETRSLPEPVAVPTAPADGTFPMTRVQHAYWIGRQGGYALGDIACHFYLEYDCPDLDLPRYERAWRQVIERHPMLRAITTRQGAFQILDHVPPYRIRVHDLTGLDETAREQRLTRLRARISRDPGPSDRWPLVQIQAARLPGGRVRLFLGVDVLVCDAGSYWIIDREVRHFYERPDEPLPAPALDFAACVRAMEENGDERAARYWRRRTLPGPPPLPVDASFEGAPRFVRRTARLEPAAWQRLRREAARRGVTPTAVLLTAYAEALAAWAETEHFSLTLTLFDRPAIHPDVDKVVGDFTSLLIHEIDRREPGPFAEHVRRVQERLFADLDHRAHSALDLLSERGAGSVPVVFTSALGLEDLVGGEPDLQWVGEQVHALSQTPQTWLDHQVLVQRGELLLQWDAVADLLPDHEVDAVFTAYAERVRALAFEPSAWEPQARPEEDDALDDALIPLRAGTQARTLFLLHPSGGDVMCYAELSRLLDERFEIVALTDPDLVGGRAPGGLPGLARRYRDAIRRRRPHGPYLLGGWSMGGSLGQEVARLLHEQGEHVAFLLMLDSNDPAHITPIAGDEEAEATVRMLGAFEAYLDVDLGVGTERERTALRDLPREARRAETASRLRARRLLGRGDDVAGRVAVFARHLRGLAAHRPGRLEDPDTATLLIRADRPATRNSGIGMGVDDTPPGLPDLGWTAHLAGPLEVHGVAADHYGLLRPPALPGLAELINRALSRL